MLNENDYMKDHRGNLVPKSTIKPIDILRDDLVKSIFYAAERTSEVLTSFKRDAMAEIAAFVEQSYSQYKVKYGGTKGNIQLLSFNGRYKVIISVNEYIAFDERLQAAKTIIDECITRWSQDSNQYLRAVVIDAFDVDKAGNINKSRILRLLRTEINDDRWKEAMKAISDSIQITGSKEYIRVYYRKPDGNYAQLPLDLSAV